MCSFGYIFVHRFTDRQTGMLITINRSHTGGGTVKVRFTAFVMLMHY